MAPTYRHPVNICIVRNTAILYFCKKALLYNMLQDIFLFCEYCNVLIPEIRDATKTLSWL